MSEYRSIGVFLLFSLFLNDKVSLTIVMELSSSSCPPSSIEDFLPLYYSCLFVVGGQLDIRI